MNDEKTLADIVHAIAGARFFSIEAKSKGVERGPKGAKVTYDDRVWRAQAQTFPYRTAYGSALEALQALDVVELHASLSPRVLTAEYRVPKNAGGGVRVETLTIEDLEAQRLALIHSLENPGERAANYKAADAWTATDFPGVVRSTSDGRYALRVYRKPGTVKTVEEPANGWHVPNRTREARARRVVQGATRLDDLVTVYLDSVREVRAGGVEWRRSPGGDLSRT